MDNIRQQVIFLTNLSHLMQKWGLQEDQWFIEDGFFLTPYLYDYCNLYPTSHFHIKVNKLAIPWQLKSDKQILPPMNSQYLKDYMYFLENNYEIIIDAKENNNFKNLIKECEVVNVNHGIRIYQQKILNRLKKMLLRFNEVPEMNPCRFHELIGRVYKYSQKFKNQNIINLLNQINAERLKKKISGIAVNAKKTRGYVKLLLPGLKINNIENNKIIVFEQAYLKYLPLIIKAKGIIAERGGITSHTAITCREFDIPGIIDVKDVLYLLRDNDFVEINQDGSIKIIKPNLEGNII